MGMNAGDITITPSTYSVAVDSGTELASKIYATAMAKINPSKVRVRVTTTQLSSDGKNIETIEVDAKNPDGSYVLALPENAVNIIVAAISRAVAQEFISHIKAHMEVIVTSTEVTVPAGIAVATAGTPSSHTGATTAPGLPEGTITGAAGNIQ